MIDLIEKYNEDNNVRLQKYTMKQLFKKYGFGRKYDFYFKYPDLKIEGSVDDLLNNFVFTQAGGLGMNLFPKSLAYHQNENYVSSVKFEKNMYLYPQIFSN